MSKKKVEVKIDSNEASQSLDTVEIVLTHEDVEDFKIEPMEWGDYRVGDVIFERKKPGDFAQSIEDGRMREQVEGMAREVEEGGGGEVYVLVEGDMGDFSNLSNTNMNPKSLRGMTASIIARNNIPVVFCSEPKYLADMIIRLGRKHAEDAPSRIHTTGAAKDQNFMEAVFSAIEGVGVETAEKLAEGFPSLSSAMQASEEQLQDVEGVGSKRAETIHQTLHKSYADSSDGSDGGSDVTVINV